MLISCGSGMIDVEQGSLLTPETSEELQTYEH